jgi:hypothetical protein
MQIEGIACKKSWNRGKAYVVALVFVVYDVATAYLVFVFVGVGAVTVTTDAVVLPLRTVTGAGVTVEVTKVLAGSY